MKVAERFLIAELLWGAGIFVPMAVVGLMDTDPPFASQVVRWLVRALVLAAFPAGVAVAPVILDASRRWRPLLQALAAAGVVAFAVLLASTVAGPAIDERARSMAQFVAAMRDVAGSWESRNDAAWKLYTTLLTPVDAMLFAAIGVQVGLWARYALPASLRRALYWFVGLGLLVTGYAIWDTTYETVVLHTTADASFAAFYTVLVPAFLCAGLALPTLALVRRVAMPGNTS